MSESGKLYRVHDADWLTMADLSRAVFATVRADKPEHPLVQKSGWYCQTEECVVREVTIAAKYPDGPLDKPQRMRCPWCGKPLTQTAWLKTLVLVPEDKPPAG